MVYRKWNINIRFIFTY